MKVIEGRGEDRDSICKLLVEAGLPVEGVEPGASAFLIVRDRGEVVGCVGMERFGEAGLLRSLAVAKGYRGLGLGRALTARMLEEARAQGVREVVLLTETARDFFAGHFGFVAIERERFDSVFRDSIEWHLPRCASAACLHRRLE